MAQFQLFFSAKRRGVAEKQGLWILTGQGIPSDERIQELLNQQFGSDTCQIGARMPCRVDLYLGATTPTKRRRFVELLEQS